MHTLRSDSYFIYGIQPSIQGLMRLRDYNSNGISERMADVRRDLSITIHFRSVQVWNPNLWSTSFFFLSHTVKYNFYKVSLLLFSVKSHVTTVEQKLSLFRSPSQTGWCLSIQKTFTTSFSLTGSPHFLPVYSSQFQSPTTNWNHPF